MKRFILLVTLSIGMALPAVGQVVVNFDDLALANYTPIPAPYGDYVDPQITLDYRTFDFATGNTLELYLEFWNSDYGDLSKVAYPGINGGTGEITFTPAVGYMVQIISFDMAGYSHVDRTNTIMRFVDASGALLLDFATLGPVPIEGNATGPQHSTFTPNFTHAGVVKLQWGTDWDIGIDNIQFQSLPIPEPSTWALLLGGCSLLTARVWRRRFRR